MVKPAIQMCILKSKKGQGTISLDTYKGAEYLYAFLILLPVGEISGKDHL